jgi:hypothetical protein
VFLGASISRLAQVTGWRVSDIFQPFLAESFKIDAFNEYRQWRLPGFPFKVIQFSEFHWIQPKFTSHLNVGM